MEGRTPLHGQSSAWQFNQLQCEHTQVLVAWSTLLKPELFMEGVGFWVAFYRVVLGFFLIKTSFSHILTLLPHFPATYSPWWQKPHDLTQAVLFKAAVRVQSPNLQVFLYFLSICLTLDIAVLNHTLSCQQINPYLSLGQSLFHSHKELAKLSYLRILRKLIWITFFVCFSVGAGGHFCSLSYLC